jgi:signal transduction histidine kinase
VELVRAPWARSPVTDLVVELGAASAGTLRDALARALGDPTLRVGYWLPAAGAYVDAAGDPVELPRRDAARAATLVERDGQPLAALVHDPAVLDDPGLVDGVAAAARLGAANARLQGEVRAQLADLAASRRRIVEAGDDERRRLELRLREGAVRRLETLALSLARVRPRAASPSRERLDEARSQLARALADLHELAVGLHPRDLVEEGLEGALGALAARSPVPVELDVSAGRVAPEAEAAAYFLCSEALTNVAKYARASRVAIRIARIDGRLEVEIADDGVGGADPVRGSGLSGLSDRVEALGGNLRLDTGPGRGTRLDAAIPL